MTPLTAEKIAELERLIKLADPKDPESLIQLFVAVIIDGPALLSLAKRVAVAPVLWVPSGADSDQPDEHGGRTLELFGWVDQEVGIAPNSSVALVIVGGEEGAQ